jgi:hypothetical protein
MGHRLYAFGINSLHFGDQAEDVGQLGLGNLEFLVVHREPGKARDFFDIG